MATASLSPRHRVFVERVVVIVNSFARSPSRPILVLVPYDATITVRPRDASGGLATIYFNRITSIRGWCDIDVGHDSYFTIILHEVLHCLGVEHDTLPNSVMLPIVPRTATLQPQHIPLLLDHSGYASGDTPIQDETAINAEE